MQRGPGPARPAGGGRAVWRALGYLRRYRGETVGALVGLLLRLGGEPGRAADGAAGHRRRPRAAALADGARRGRRAGRASPSGAACSTSCRATSPSAPRRAWPSTCATALFARIQRLSFSYYDQAQTGQLLTRLTNDVEQVRTFVGTRRGAAGRVAGDAARLRGAAVRRSTPRSPPWRCATIAAHLLAAQASSSARVGPLFGKVQMALGRLNARAAGGPAGPARGARLLRRGARGGALRRDQRRAARPQPRASIDARSPTTSRS